MTNISWRQGNPVDTNNRSEAHPMHRLSYTRSLAAFIAVFASLAISPASRADIDRYALFRDIFLSQTSASPPTAADHYHLSARVFSVNSGDFDTATLTYPGPDSPVQLTLVSPTLLNFVTLFSTQAAMDTAFPFGTYTVEATNTSTSVSEQLSINYTQNAYPNSIPALTAATFRGLQGLDSTHAFRVAFKRFVTNAAANESFIFFTIHDIITGQVVVDRGFLPATTTSVNLPANTLHANTAYVFELNFSSRIAGATFPRRDQGFELRTQGSFRTGPVVVPLFSLAFPLPGLTPYTAEIRSVMDHYNHGKDSRLGCYDGTIVTYRGDRGDAIGGEGGVRAYPFCKDKTRLGDYYSPSQGVYLSYDGHPGYDYPTPLGTNVRAAADGTVKRSNVPGALGEIWISHSSGLYTMYNHLSTSFVKPNDPVTKGQIIGQSRKTGSASNFEHLHFSVFIGPPTNPLSYVDPYGWDPRVGADVLVDPHTETSVCLWEVCQ